MKIVKNPEICNISMASHDSYLINQVVKIEALVQQNSWSKHQIIELLEQDINQCWGILNPIAHKNEKVMAYCITSSVFEVAEVLRIGTHPDFQRRGYAFTLLKTLIELMQHRKLDKILLEVSAKNKKAISLYQSLGFECIHIRKNYYISTTGKDRADALIMQYTRIP